MIAGTSGDERCPTHSCRRSDDLSTSRLVSGSIRVVDPGLRGDEDRAMTAARAVREVRHDTVDGLVGAVPYGSPTASPSATASGPGRTRNSTRPSPPAPPSCGSTTGWPRATGSPPSPTTPTPISWPSSPAPGPGSRTSRSTRTSPARTSRTSWTTARAPSSSPIRTWPGGSPTGSPYGRCARPPTPSWRIWPSRARSRPAGTRPGWRSCSTRRAPPPCPRAR